MFLLFSGFVFCASVVSCILMLLYVCLYLTGKEASTNLDFHHFFEEISILSIFSKKTFKFILCISDRKNLLGMIDGWGAQAPPPICTLGMAGK